MISAKVVSLMLTLGLLVLSGCEHLADETHAFPFNSDDPTAGSRISEITPAKDALPPPLTELSDQESLAAAIQRLQKLSTEGNAEASYRLGQAYASGFGVEVDLPRAFESFLAAAELEHANAQAVVSLMFHQGNGVQKDGKQVIHWATKAADQGLDAAQHWLASLYHQGLYVRQNAGKAFQLYELAAQQGLPEAEVKLALCFVLGEGTQRDIPKARYWFTRSHRGGIDLRPLRDNLWEQAVELDQYPIVRISEHKAKFDELRKFSSPASETYQTVNGRWAFYQDSVAAREESEFDKLMIELKSGQAQREQRIAIFLDAIEMIDVLLKQES
ncbi:MAG: tetratricopeptide repeat protein [Planctomycetota bacterium]